MTLARLNNLTASLSTSKLDAVILNPGPTLTYLTGVDFHLMERPVVLFVAPGHDPVLVLPELEMLKVDMFPYNVRAFAYGENPSEWDAAFRKASQALGLDGKRIGVEPRQLRLLEFRHVKSGAPESEYPDASDVLAGLRLRKDKAEVDKMRRAVKIAQDALEATIPLIKTEPASSSSVNRRISLSSFVQAAEPRPNVVAFASSIASSIFATRNSDATGPKSSSQ